MCQHETPQPELMKVAPLTLVHLAPADIGQLTDAQGCRAGRSGTA
jgi:hypothetical protein